MSKDEILFDDPEDDLLGAGAEEAPEQTQAEIVTEVQETFRKGQPLKKAEETTQEEPQTRQRWYPAGASFRGELADEERMFSVNGQMVPESQLQAAQEDPDFYNFLFMMQKKPLEPDPAGPICVGGDIRNPDYEALEAAIGQKCPFCQKEVTEDEVQASEIGSLVSYGGQIYHWEHLCLWALVKCKGHYKKTADKYFLPLEDVKALRTIQMRSIAWGRLGYSRVGGD